MENFIDIEKKWQKFWEENPNLYHAIDNDKSKTKKYVLVEFPYPSGSGLHIGHTFSFTGADVYARLKRMQGFNVMFPMGWDAFGLPTENYAIKTKQKPQKVTKDNTDMFRRQMKALAFSFDWAREVNTTDPKYYKWTQWIFIQLYNKGLAYKQEMPINWCPSCKIGLANEEVVNGHCERCGSEVERRTISQWVVKITEYADKLIEGLKDTDFIEKVKQAQINWIGKSDGAKIRFKLSPNSASILSSSRPQTSSSDDSGRKIDASSDHELEVFTTRPDTLFGATFMVIAPEHELVSRLMDNEEIKKYVVNARSKSDMERTELAKDKTGVFSGLYAINPVNGKEIPIWISDFVLASYGTGAIMSVPAHDERDYDFAKKFGLEIVPVIEPEGGWDFEKAPYTDVDNGKIINSEPINGLTPAAAFEKMLTWIKEKGIGEKTSSYHLRDWIFSRQHYWGEPIPMIYCEEHGWQPVPENQLPIVLPEVEQYEPTDNGESPLSTISNWVDTVCPVCGKKARRETDTMPNWAGSDWYFLRYIDPDNDTEIASQEKMKYWMPVDVYVGGDEHNTLHLLYSRFIYKFLYDLGVMPKENPEPYYKRLSHGVILGPDNQRMSKSRGNVIVPEDVSTKYGVDVVRMYLMFMGPFDSTMAWNENTLMGVKRFLDRLQNYFDKQSKQINNENASNAKVDVIINKLIKKVTEDTDNFKYNTAIAKMMEALNELNALGETYIGGKYLKDIVKMLAPFAPYSTEEEWSKIKNDKDEISVHIAKWPVADETYLVEDKMRVAIAINGKVRDEIEIESENQNNQSEIISAAKETEKIKSWLSGKSIVKEIYVPGKMVNLVVRD